MAAREKGAQLLMQTQKQVRMSREDGENVGVCVYAQDYALCKRRLTSLSRSVQNKDQKDRFDLDRSKQGHLIRRRRCAIHTVYTLTGVREQNDPRSSEEGKERNENSRLLSLTDQCCRTRPTLDRRPTASDTLCGRFPFSFCSAASPRPTSIPTVLPPSWIWSRTICRVLLL